MTNRTIVLTESQLRNLLEMTMREFVDQPYECYDTTEGYEAGIVAVIEKQLGLLFPTPVDTP